MSDVLDLINQQIEYDDAWYRRLWHSLGDSQGEWLSAVPPQSRMSDEHAWNLLGWIETASSELVRNPNPRTLQLAIFARALLTQSAIDDRDIWIIVFLLRRGAQLAGVDYLAAVSAGCAQAGALGEIVYESLINASDKTPPSYEERGEGKGFEFHRNPVEFDAIKLLSEIGDGRTPLGDR
jgi:hypothetical protein